MKKKIIIWIIVIIAILYIANANGYLDSIKSWQIDMNNTVDRIDDISKSTSFSCKDELNGWVSARKEKKWDVEDHTLKTDKKTFDNVQELKDYINGIWFLKSKISSKIDQHNETPIYTVIIKESGINKIWNEQIFTSDVFLGMCSGEKFEILGSID